MDVAGGMYWIVAREQQRIEQYREPRMKIPPSGIQIENIRRADDSDATGFHDAMELARERELVLEMLDDLEAETARTRTVLEAVPEDLELKTAIFQELDRVCPPEDILASNTSALSVTEIGARTKRPDRVIGLHFLVPVPTVPLVEVVRGLSTSDATLWAKSG